MDSNAAGFFKDDEPQVLQAPGTSGQAVDVVLERFNVRENLPLDRFGHRGFW
jgi:hypothetical protein